MITLIAQYMLAGLVIAFILETTIRWSDQEVSFMERIALITLWPIMLVVFIYNFIKAFFN